MEFAHIKKEKNFTTEEMIEITYHDARYPGVQQIMWLSLKDANTLGRELNNFVSGIPY